MRFKEELYRQDGVTFAQNIDRAWAAYTDTQGKEEDRCAAQSFLIYVFNIKNLDKLNEKFLAFMEKFWICREKNADYIPGCSPEHLNLTPEEELLLLAKIDITKKIQNPKLKALLTKKEIIDVNSNDKLADRAIRTRIQYFDSQQRAAYRVHIYQGKFYQKGELFSSAQYKAHRKDGFAAFTINANGELSIFNHFGGGDGIVHSSMNAGCPVMCAGELVIQNGELITINSYSGHYEPSLFNIYRALEFFSKKEIDVSRAKVHLFKNPSSDTLKIDASLVTKVAHNFYEIPASIFFISITEGLNKSLNSITSDTEKYRSWSFMTMLFNIRDFIIRSNLTNERKKIADEVYDTAIQFLPQLSADDSKNTKKAEDLIQKLEILRDKNSELSIKHGKNKASGRFHAKIEHFLLQARAIVDLKNPSVDADKIEKMKSIF